MKLRLRNSKSSVYTHNTIRSCMDASICLVYVLVVRTPLCTPVFWKCWLICWYTKQRIVQGSEWTDDIGWRHIPKGKLSIYFLTHCITIRSSLMKYWWFSFNVWRGIIDTKQIMGNDSRKIPCLNNNWIWCEFNSKTPRCISNLFNLYNKCAIDNFILSKMFVKQIIHSRPTQLIGFFC